MIWTFRGPIDDMLPPTTLPSSSSSSIWKKSLFIFKCELIISLVSGVLHEHMTLIWCLSPLIGFFLTPILGSLSDRCKSNLGRRRPFIVLLSIGVVLGEKIKDIYVNDMYVLYCCKVVGSPPWGRHKNAYWCLLMLTDA